MSREFSLKHTECLEKYSKSDQFISQKNNFLFLEYAFCKKRKPGNVGINKGAKFSNILVDTNKKNIASFGF